MAVISMLLFSLSVPVAAQEKAETTRHKAGHRTFHSEIVINASPEVVWEVLTDFDSYPAWSVVFVGLEGDFRDGGTATASFTRKGKVNTYEHVMTVEDGKSFSWSDKFAMGMRDHHVFRVEAAGKGTRFVHEDEAKGGATWLFGKTVSKYHEENYPLFNRALKAEAEKRADP